MEELPARSHEGLLCAQHSVDNHARVLQNNMNEELHQKLNCSFLACSGASSSVRVCKLFFGAICFSWSFQSSTVK